MTEFITEKDKKELKKRLKLSLIIVATTVIGVCVWHLYNNIFNVREQLSREIRTGNAKAIQKIISEDISIVNEDKNSITPLIEAIYYDNLEIVIMLVGHGADINMRGGRHENTPLMVAVSKGNYEMIKWLLMNGAKIDETNMLGRSPLIEAARRGDLRIIELLAEYKPNLDLRCKSEGKTALEYAVDKSFYNVAKFLIRIGAKCTINIELCEKLSQ